MLLGLQQRPSRPGPGHRDHDVVGVQLGPPSSAPCCYKTCPNLGLLRGSDGFLVDADVQTAKHRLTKDPEYKKHLYGKRLAFDSRARASLYQVMFLTNRQKRLVAYYKIFRHIYTKGKYRKVLALPSCVCQMVRKWWPDDGDDQRLRGAGGGGGDGADAEVIEVEEEEGEEEEEEGEGGEE